MRRPCARDGHSASLNGDKMIIFGGDRHLISFNDLYMISLLDWEKKISENLWYLLIINLRDFIIRIIILFNINHNYLNNFKLFIKRI